MAKKPTGVLLKCFKKLKDCVKMAKKDTRRVLCVRDFSKNCVGGGGVGRDFLNLGECARFFLIGCGWGLRFFLMG